MSENKLTNIASAKYYISVFILMITASVPIAMAGIVYDVVYVVDFILYNSFYFQIFYFFCYSFLFIINSDLKNINKRTILITFLLFLLLLLLGIFTSAPLKNEIPDILNFFKSNIMINKSILSYIIFFIIILLADNNFNIKDNISDTFTKLGDIIFFSAVLETIVLFFFIFAAFIVDRYYRLIDNEILYDIIQHIIFYSLLFFSLLIPFLSFLIQKKFKTILSIYFSRLLMFLNLFLIFALFFALFYEPIRPFENNKSFIIYNTLLYLSVFTLYFTRADYKAGIITKAMYIIFPILAFLFNILVLSADVYRVIISETKINEISIIVLNIITAVNLIYIIIQNIKSVIKILKNNINDTVIGNNKIYNFIYVYGIYSFTASFIAPIIVFFTGSFD